MSEPLDEKLLLVTLTNFTALTNGNWSLVKIGSTSQAERLRLNDLCSCSPNPYTYDEGGWVEIWMN